MTKSGMKFIFTFIIIIGSALLVNLHKPVGAVLEKPFSLFPGSHNGWQMASESTFSENILRVLEPTDYMLRSYTKDGEGPVFLYIGYHGGDKGGIHSPKHCMPGSGWYVSMEQKTELNFNGVVVPAVLTTYQKGQSKELFLYWYQLKGRAINSDYALKLYELYNSLFYARKESAFIRISVPFVDAPEKAIELAKRFAQDFHPLIMEFLPQ
ncbi:MAG: EpsI family protein [Dissulfurispiraceae bacterium]|jgi:EpsI family protein|nr:EpsI family protein [Dissulfurispiraceae bacterium]